MIAAIALLMIPSKFKALVLFENGGHHIAYSKRAQVWLNDLAKRKDFEVDYVNDTNNFDAAYLSHYKLIIQLDYPPYTWPKKAMDAFQDYIDNGRGGWVGFHHATLLGEFDGYPMWNWFSGFMGGIQFKNYIATFADATVNVEKKDHPVFEGLPASFEVKKEEWYTYDRSPRANVEVLASVDEGTYKPDSDVKMGDHPVVWTNPKMKARNIYIFMGHAPELFDNPNYCRLFENSIFWAAGG